MSPDGTSTVLTMMCRAATKDIQQKRQGPLPNKPRASDRKQPQKLSQAGKAVTADESQRLERAAQERVARVPRAVLTTSSPTGQG